ncbi:alpha/beta-hydrolase [Ramaria rubella]|nr:alpha/beta-hydrolase [Ramaria rubella]
MPPPPLDLPNERPFFKRHRIFIACFLLRLLVDIVSLIRTIWPIPNRFKIHIDTGKTGPCRLCVYTPKHSKLKNGPSGRKGVVVHLHGGGWSISRPEAEAPLCRYLCDKLDAIVVAPDYRKAPFYPYPHALEQCYFVLTWIASGGLSYELRKHNNSGEFDLTRIALSGASSGSNLAASLTLLTLERPLSQSSRVVGLSLLYPALNLEVPYKDKLARVDPNRVLPPWMSQLFLLSYLPPPRSTADPYVSPALAPASDLARFPSTVILTAAYDYLAHEAEEFASSLRDVGVKVEHKRFPRVGHAFDGMPARNKKQRELNEGARDEAWDMMARVFRDVLGSKEEQTLDDTK